LLRSDLIEKACEDDRVIETHYKGPRTTTVLRFNGSDIQIVRPADPDRLLNDPEVYDLNHRDDYMPYWAYLWPGAYLLAEAVSREPGLEGQDVLEIGCGLGLAGLVALARGSRVFFSDYDETPLRFVAQSVAVNGFGSERSAFERLDWRQPPARSFPLILGADVLYERRLVPLVCGVIRAMLAPGGTALVAGPYRVATEDLEPMLEQHGLTSVAVPVTSSDESGRPVRGTLHRIQRS
jgi:predicted nicotinamide N-methyase